jgi:hypothetical protein
MKYTLMCVVVSGMANGLLVDLGVGMTAFLPTHLPPGLDLSNDFI